MNGVRAPPSVVCAQGVSGGSPGCTCCSACPWLCSPGQLHGDSGLIWTEMCIFHSAQVASGSAEISRLPYLAIFILKSQAVE